MSAEILLACLDKVKHTGTSTWLACCPAHADRSPSLSIRELDDGRTLVHCFAGCSVEEVLAAVGLTFSDLSPPRAVNHLVKPERRPFPAADVLRAVAFEALVVSASAVMMADGRRLREADIDRLITAASRIGAALTAAGVSHHG